MSNWVTIGDVCIGGNSPPFIVAEMSGNHNGSLSRALKIVEAAAEAGVHGFKIQTYTPDSMTLDIGVGDFVINDANSPWNGRSLFELYEQSYTPLEWHEPIYSHARKFGMIPFSTPFDEAGVDFLETLGTPCYKIASFENTDTPLIIKAAQTGKPLIISVGMATRTDLDQSITAARDAGCRELILLKCTSAYPASPLDANNRTIPHLKEVYGCEVGLSDHTLGMGVAVAAVAVGATVIEKHFTLSRNDGGVDAAFSVEPSEMKEFVTEATRAWQSLGEIKYGPVEAEKPSLKHRRSIYIVKDLKRGDVLTRENLRLIRPGEGLPPKYYDELLGRTICRDVERGMPMSWEFLDEN